MASFYFALDIQQICISQTSAILPIYQTDEMLTSYTIRNPELLESKRVYDFGVWGDAKSARGAHRNSKAKSAFFDGGTPQT